MGKIQIGTKEDILMKKRLGNIKEMIKIVEECDNDFQKAFKLRRIYSSYENFRTAYFPKVKTSEGMVSTLHYYFDEYETELKVLGSLYKRYEEEGFFDLALKEERFVIRQANDLDSRFVINSYIHDFDSYDLDLFLSKYKIDKAVFRCCVDRIKNHDPELYEQFEKTREDNKTKKLVMPIYSINQIIEGITTGKTIDGKVFDVFEFYRLAPFKNKDIDEEVRNIGKDFPNILIFKKLKQAYKNQGENHNTVSFTYSDNLYLFTCCFNKNQADILKKYMDENHIRNLTPVHKGSTINFYTNVSDDAEFTMDDAIEIFNTMDEEKLPYYQEIYSRLKQEKLNKKLIKENK